MAVAGAATPTPDLAPRLHLKAPTHLLHILQEFDEGVRLDAPNTALRALRQAFSFLLGYCTDLLGVASVKLGASAEMFILDKADVYRPSEAETRLKEGLYFLSQKEEPLAKALVAVFFHNNEPSQFFLLTQGGRVEGKMGGLDRVSDFCKEPKRPPGRSESLKLRNLYLPHLEAWLNSLAPIWDSAEILWERTQLTGEQRICYLLQDHQIEIGQRLELQDCKACIPCRVLHAPDEWVKGEPFLGVPQEVPEHTLHLVDRFQAALEQQDVIESTRLLRDTLEFLLRYFAGVGKTLCQAFDCLSDDDAQLARKAESVDHCEVLLQSTVEALKSHQDDAAARDFVGVFYRRDSHLVLQPRSHTNILLLEGVLSSWFKQERGRQPSEDRYRKDFERFFPLFRDWVRSMGPYFSHTEHFGDPPTPHGQLPLTIRCGEHLLELVDEEYCLRIRQCPVCLPNPIWLQQQATEQAKAKAPPTTTLTAEQLLRRANTKPAEGEPSAEAPPAPEAPKAEVVQAYPGEFRPLEIPSDAPKFLGRMLRRLDVRLRRGELPESRDALRDCLDYLVRYWAGVSWACVKECGKLSSEHEAMAARSLSIQECERLLGSMLKTLGGGLGELAEEITQVYFERDLFSDELKPLGSHTRILQTDFEGQMQLMADFCDSQEGSTVHQARRDLKTYLPVLRDWLARSQTFFEQCIHHEEEPDKEGRMELVVQWDKSYLELVAPDYSFHVRPGSDQVPELEVPEWVEPEAPVEQEVAKPRAITSEELALMEPFLIHKVQFVGIQLNSQGKPCKSGVISIQNAGGGSLTGRAFTNHPCIEVSPNRFRDKTQLTYWLDESAIPKDFVPVLVLRSGGDERQVTLAEMRPLSRFSTLSKSQAMTLLWLPNVAGAIGLNFVIAVQAKKIQTAVGDLRGRLREIAPDTLEQCQGYGAYIGGLFLLYAALAPVATLVVYRNFSHSVQDLLSKPFQKIIWSTTALAVVSVVINSAVFRGVRHPEITAANLFRLTPWGIVFSVCMTIYSLLESERKLDEWISDPIMRKVTRVALGGLLIFLWALALS